MSNATAAPIVVCLKDLQPRTLSWLWPGRIALGKLCLLDGDPGQGKSLFTVDLCARLTRGQPLPDGAAGHPPINVLFLCEDDLSDTVLPRLQQLTGEAGRVFAYQGMQAEQRSAFRSPLFPRDAAVLQRVIEQTDSRLVIIDPLVDYLDPAVCNVYDHTVRLALRPLARVAEATGAALLIVRHLNKRGGTRALYRGTGSITIIGTVRTAFLLGPDPEEPSVRVLACTKSNLGPLPPPLTFRIEPAEPHPRLHWLGEAELAANDLLARTPPPVLPRARARAFLQERLQRGPCPVDGLMRGAQAEGISEKTLLRAKQELKIEHRQVRQDGRPVFYWNLAGQ